MIDWLKQLLGAHRFAPTLTAVGMREEIATLLNRHRVGFVRNVAVAGYLVDFLLDEGVVVIVAGAADHGGMSWPNVRRFVAACEQRGVDVAQLVLVSSWCPRPMWTSSITVNVVHAEAA